MERLVDPLTTTDAKLWADEFMKVKAQLGEPKFDHAMMLGWFANAIMQGYDEGQRRAKADAQATVEALREQLRLANIDQANAEAQANDLRQQVEALQRERDEARDRSRAATQLVIDTIGSRGGPEGLWDAVSRLADKWKTQIDNIQHYQAALDAEREKVKGLEALQVGFDGQDEVLDIKKSDYYALRDALTQLQALVRAFFKARAANDQETYTKAFVALKRTLDATTPAGRQE